MDIRRTVAGIGRAMIAAGVLILLFVAYQLWGTGLAEARSQDRLRSDFLDLLEAPTTTSVPDDPVVVEPEPDDGGGPAPATTTAPAPRTPTGAAVAIIRIPKIGVEKAVVEGVSVAALKQGPGHYPTTPMPGQPGNAAIAGHRTTYGAPFYRLDELKVGDAVQVTTRQGAFDYEVTRSLIVRPEQNEVLAPSSENLLTLTTCNPRFSARQRLIVVARLVDTPAEAPPPPPPPAAEEPTPTTVAPGATGPVTTIPAVTPEEEVPSLDEDLSTSGAPVSKGPAVLWGLLAAAVWIGTWLLSKKWGRLAAYAMGTPVFLVVLFVFFENFARLLPANI
ncbi:MAG TPA: class E sortase [Acidimicrobiales bacterium]|nr:class E sortase [Acidimicrobiales bacterium]